MSLATANHQHQTPIEGKKKPISADDWWDSYVGRLKKQMQLWQVMAFLMLGLAGWGWGVYAQKSSQSTITPFIFVADPQGMVLFSGPPERYTIPDVWILTRLGKWVEQVRTQVPADALPIQKGNWQEAWMMTRGDARVALDTYMRELDPTPQKGELPRVKVELLAKGKLTDGYRIKWQEEHTTASGKTLKVLRYSADFHTELIPPKTVEMANETGYGIYIKWFAWYPEPEHGGLP